MSVFIFPGQGSQYVSMAMDFNNNFNEAKNTFIEIEDITKINLRKIITENQEDELNQTKYTQISIFAASMAIFNTLVNQFNLTPKVVMGHSLGEYSALVSSNVLTLADASNLIQIRGNLMQSAILPNTSGMAALIGKNANSIDDIIKKNKLDIFIANDNSPIQVVVSGLLKDLDKTKEILISNGVKKFIKLNVSAAFHSKYMEEAQTRFAEEINNIKFSDSNIPIISNYDANFNSDLESIITAIKKQMANRVRWVDSIKKLEETGNKKIVEIGPGKVLSGLISRISKTFDITSVDKITDLEKIN
tara:strand:- start:13407 stop:14318 length:912 start_codon:yes stop_codon:yes gene_type:complete